MKKPKRRRDPMPLAELVIDMATGEVPNDSPKGPETQITKARRAAGINDMSCALQAPRLRKLVLGMLVIFLYCLVTVTTQESNAAAFKTVYDLSMINRIASRIETVVEDLYQTKHARLGASQYCAGLISGPQQHHLCQVWLCSR